jgi:integrase
MKLTKAAADKLSLPAGKTDHIAWDDDLKGFGLRMRASGGKVVKSWVFQYRFGGKTRRVSFDAVLTPEQARKKAEELRAHVTLGEDPGAERENRRKADQFSFAAMAGKFLVAKKRRVRPRTFTETRRYLEGPYFKPLHPKAADRIERRDVADRLQVIAEEYGETTAARARSAFSDLFAWGMAEGLVEHNPIVGTRRPKAAPPRERVLTNPELVAVWHEAGDDDFGRIVRLLICTGQRRGEVGGIADRELDERGLWTIPGSRTKNHRQHTVPLGPLAIGIIESVPRMVGRDNLFGSRDERGFTGWGLYKQRLDDRLGDRVAPWTLHDIRRTFCTRLADIGVEPHVIEAAVNHHSGHKAGVAGIYNRSRYEHQVKAALVMWDDHLRAMLGLCRG